MYSIWEGGRGGRDWLECCFVLAMVVVHIKDSGGGGEVREGIGVDMTSSL